MINKLISQIEQEIKLFKIDCHNDNTFNWSKGYLKCLQNLLININSLKEELNVNVIQSKLSWNGSLTYNNNPKYIVLHHAESKSCTIYDIHSWHLNNGWLGCGYHYFVRKDGTIFTGRPELAQGSHCPGKNTQSIGICAEGEYMEESMPDVQFNAIVELCKDIYTRYAIIETDGHKEYYSTSCPGTNYPLESIKNAISTNSSSTIQGWNKNNTGWWYCTDVDNGYYYKDQWKEIDNEWYSFDNQGYARQSTWIQDGGRWYFLQNSCKMAKSCWFWINDECYCFAVSGALYVNTTTPDGYKVDINGAWIN